MSADSPTLRVDEASAALSRSSRKLLVDAHDAAGSRHAALFPAQGRDSPWFPEYVGRELDFAREVLGLSHPKTQRIALWEAQRYMLEALFKHRFVVVRGCRSSTKTYAAARAIIPTFFYTAPSRVLALSTTLEQVRDSLCAHIVAAKEGARVPLTGETSAYSVRIDPQHYVIGIPSRNPNRVRSYHSGIVVPEDPDSDEAPDPVEAIEYEAEQDADRLLVVVDEAQGVENQEVFRALRGMLMRKNTYCLIQGNPMLGLDDDHEFVHVCKPGSKYHKIKISAFPDDLQPDPLPADRAFFKVPEYIIPESAKQEALRIYEKTDPLFLSDWLAQFSAGSTSTSVITRTILEAAKVAFKRPPLGPRIGVDVGGTGDATVLSLFMDGEKIADHEHRCAKEDSEAMMNVAALIAAFAVRWGEDLAKLKPDRWDGSPIPGERISVDDTGLNGVCDRLSQLGQSVDRVNFGARPSRHWPALVGRTQFPNVRCEMYWCARRGLQDGQFFVPERFQKSWQELQWVHYSIESDPKGPKIVLEPKDDIRARNGRSPDHADADVLAMRETRVSVGIARTGPKALTSFARRGRRRGR